MFVSTDRESRDSSITVQVFEEFAGSLSEWWLESVAECALAVEGECTADARRQVGLVIADDDTVRALNKRYRGLDEYTDVLSFSFSHHGHYYGAGESPFERSAELEFVLPLGEQLALGEVIISHPQVVRQAEQAAHPVDKELAILLTHGVLHLLGYDHENDGDQSEMEKLQSQILRQVWSDG